MTSPIQEQLSTALSATYKIERELGRGAMALVYLATDHRGESWPMLTQTSV